MNGRRVLAQCLALSYRIKPLYSGIALPNTFAGAFSTTARRYAKLYVDRENKFAHDVLETSLKKYQIFRIEPLDDQLNAQPCNAELPGMVLQPPTAAETTLDEVILSFCALAKYCKINEICISEARFSKFAALFCDVVHKLSDEQLLETLRLFAQLPPTDTPKSANFVEIWNTLDIVCCQRIQGWGIDELLMVSDAWYTLNLAKLSEFVSLALRKLGRKVRRMRPEQLVHTMFFLNVVRKPVSEMFDFEVNLARCIDAISLQEIAVMAIGFFKTQTPIRDPQLIEKIYERLMLELDTVEDITLVCLLKVLRYSSRIPQADSMWRLLDALSPQIERISLLACLHVALLGSDIQSCHQSLIELVLQRFNRDIDQARLKDLERVCLVLGVFNFESTSGIEKELSMRILDKLKTNVDEIIKHPRCFSTCLHFLSIKGYYDMDMISSVLDPRFIRHAFGSNMNLGKDMFHLDSFVKINLRNENYTGHQLQDRQRRTMGRMLTDYIPYRNQKYKLSMTDRILLEVKETTDRIFRANVFKHILPHFQRPDIVICYNRKDKKAVDLSEECPQDYHGVILTRKELLGDAETDDIDTVAIVVAGWNNVVRGKDRYTGLFDMKLQQLQMLGHKSIVIHWQEWRDMETAKDREHFIKRRLATVINL